MKSIKNITLFVFLGLVFYPYQFVLANSARQPVTEIKTKFSQVYQDRKTEFSGMAYAIFNSTEILHSEGFGTSSWGGGQAISPEHSQFRFDSTSKLFTAVAVARLTESGILSLETSIMDLKKVKFVEYLNKNETPDRLKKWKKIKIKHLLSHQAGISKDLPDARVFWNSEALTDNSYPSTKDLYNGLLKIDFIYEAGETQGAAKYSNLGINLLARIIEDINPDKMSYPAFVKKYVFDQLGMNNSVFNLDPNNNSLVSGYGTYQPGVGPIQIPDVYDVGSYDGSIGLAASINDVAVFGKHLLKAALFKENALFAKNSISDFLSPVAKNSNLSKARVMSNGFAWRFRPLKENLNDNTEEDLWLGFTGFGYAFESILLVNPIKNIGIVLAVNSTTYPPGTFHFWDAMVAIMKDSKNIKLNQKANSLLAETRSNILFSEQNLKFIESDFQKVAAEDLKKFQGVYFADNMYLAPTAEIKIEQDSKEGFYYLSFHGRKIVPVNIEKGEFRFTRGADVLFNGEPVEFYLDSNGKVQRVVLAHVKELLYKNPLN